MARPAIPTLSNQEREELIRQDSVGIIKVRSLVGMVSNDKADKTLKVITNDKQENMQLALVEDYLLNLERGRYKFFFDPQVNLMNQIVYIGNKSVSELLNIQKMLMDHHFHSVTNHEAIRPSLNPRLHVFDNIFRFILEHFGPLKSNKVVTDERGVQRFFHLIDNYLNKVRSAEVVKTLKNWRMQHTRNHKALMSYIDNLLAQYESLYVINLHFGFVENLNGIRHPCSYEQITHAVKKMLHNKHRNPMWKEDLVGHIWKVEHITLFGFTARMLLFYRGETASSHEDDAEEITLDWLHSITDGKGVAFSRLSESEHKGFISAELLLPEYKGQLISKNDHDKVNELKRFLNYLLQIENLFGIKGQSINVFNKGYLPKTKNFM